MKVKRELISKKTVYLNPEAGLDDSKVVLSLYDTEAMITTFDCFDDVSNRYMADQNGLDKIRRLKKVIEEVEKYLEDKLKYV